MRLSFYGGVGEVTGSRHLLEAGGTRVLLDCGLFQGHRHEAIEKNKACPFKPAELDAVLLSHGHMDHSGGLPLLVKKGFRGPIHCTRPTEEICGIMLMDSARLQQEDAEFFNKIHARAGDGQSIEPLYDEEDARVCLSRFKAAAYESPVELGRGVSARLLNAGHVLGSAMIEVSVRAPRGVRRVLFTGDLGRRKMLLMDPPDVPENADYLLIESTYGDRLHEPISKVEEGLTGVIRRACEEKGCLLIPSFALERTQEIVFVIEKLRRQRAIPDVPLYVDSPMALSLTEIFDRHKADFSFAPEFRAYVKSEGDPFGFESVRYVRTVEESKALNEAPGPLIIVSGSGMCEGGRILHHLRHRIGSDSTTILIVGYQAQGTLGRRLQEGARKVKLFGLEHEVWARVETMHTFSAHADQGDLLWFMRSLAPRPRKIFLVHGDPEDRWALSKCLKDAGIDRVECPEYGDSFQLE